MSVTGLFKRESELLFGMQLLACSQNCFMEPLFILSEWGFSYTKNVLF